MCCARGNGCFAMPWNSYGSLYCEASCPVCQRLFQEPPHSALFHISSVPPWCTNTKWAVVFEENMRLVYDRRQEKRWWEIHLDNPHWQEGLQAFLLKLSLMFGRQSQMTMWPIRLTITNTCLVRTCLNPKAKSRSCLRSLCTALGRPLTFMFVKLV